MKHFPRGSEWRKWDLHVHVPGTKLSDGYGTSPETLDRFCNYLEASDVAAFGIADYFSVDRVYEVIGRYRELHPRTMKALFPNVELRLNESVNGDKQIVDIHLLFHPDTPKETAQRLLQELKTQISDSCDRNLRCSELTDQDQFKRATVTRRDIETAILETYGKGATPTDHLLIIVPANNNGIRAENGRQRKANLADEIDKLSDAIFGNSGNTRHYLKKNRLEDKSQQSVPKPVFAGSDAHDFTQLEAWLGKSVETEGVRKEVTWIKADPTFEGLQQTLVEPEERVRIQPGAPDAKEPYKVISTVHFSGTGDFPEAIPLNQNLVSIIGSRSSGKSALLAYIAYAVDPGYTVRQQIATGAVAVETKAGPAAGKTWSDVAHIQCRVEWADGQAEAGRVIYIPQNTLYAVSERPEQITEKIRPALFRLDADLATAHQRMESDLSACKTAIRSAVEQWFGLGERLLVAETEVKNLGDPKAIAATRDALAQRVSDLRAASTLAAEDISAYQDLMGRLGRIQIRSKLIREESSMLAPFLQKTGSTYTAADIVGASIELRPDLASLPLALQATLTAIVQEVQEPLRTRIRDLVVAYQVDLDAEAARLTAEDASLRSENAELIAKNEANSELEEALSRHKKQEEVLGEIASKEEVVKALVAARTEQAATIQRTLARRGEVISQFVDTFSAVSRTLDGMTFGVETGIEDYNLRRVSSDFNRQGNTEYFDRSSELIDYNKVLAAPHKFLQDLEGGIQRVKANRNASVAAIASGVLELEPEVRFCASLEEDRIGGFERSSMTPGKQALFALTLILNESTDPWPLLIDQPEDDLDSRSIYDTIVKYLSSRKRVRQILMVTHNANLVIGADSEQVIVANRHGADRKNRDSRMFEYFTGSLEHSLPATSSEFVLESRGIREHACEILDGGEEAFKKRRDKYNI
jgi:hypothetical protein